MHWKNELGLLSTYRNLLVICICGNWQDSAKDIVDFITSKFIKTPMKSHDLAVMLYNSVTKVTFQQLVAN